MPNVLCLLKIEYTQSDLLIKEAINAKAQLFKVRLCIHQYRILAPNLNSQAKFVSLVHLLH